MDRDMAPKRHVLFERKCHGLFGEWEWRGEDRAHILDGGILEALGGMPNLTELKVDLASITGSNCTDAARTQIFAGLRALPATLTHVDLYFNFEGYTLMADCVRTAVAVPPGKLRNLIIAPSDLRYDEPPLHDIFSGLEAATGLTELRWEASDDDHKVDALGMPSMRSLTLCPALTDIRLTVDVDGDVALALLEMPSLR